MYCLGRHLYDKGKTPINPPLKVAFRIENSFLIIERWSFTEGPRINYFVVIRVNSWLTTFCLHQKSNYKECGSGFQPRNQIPRLAAASLKIYSMVTCERRIFVWKILKR
jgi:hypothetical protein